MADFGERLAMTKIRIYDSVELLNHCISYSRKVLHHEAGWTAPRERQINIFVTYLVRLFTQKIASPPCSYLRP